jgi:hypothetical protein
VFLSVRQSDKNGAVDVARELQRLGFGVCATRGTAKTLAEAGIVVQVVNKVNEGRPHIVDMIKNGEIDVLVNTVDEKRQAIRTAIPSAAAPAGAYSAVHHPGRCQGSVRGHGTCGRV